MPASLVMSTPNLKLLLSAAWRMSLHQVSIWLDVHTLRQLPMQHEPVIVLMKAFVGVCRQADQAYDVAESDRHYLHKQTVSQSGAYPDLAAAQQHIRELQRSLQLLERRCAGKYQ